MKSVTVVIPTIPGRERLYQRAVLSAQAQTYRVVGDSGVQIHVQLDTDREGAATTRNRALAQVDADFVAWLDDDDELLPNHVEVCVDALERERADIAYPGMIAVGGRDPLACPLHGVLVNPFGVPFGREQAHHLRHVGNFIPITWVGRTELIKAVGGFPQPTPDPSKGSGRIEEDYGLLIALLDAGARFTHVPIRTWKYYFHDSNTGGRGEGQI
jgi:glycosyltransferase involved in cell wall biosynthesis